MDLQPPGSPHRDGRPVVVGVDGSRPAADALRAGARAAAARGAALEVVLAFPWSEADVVPAPEGFDGLAVLRMAAEQVLEEAATAARTAAPGLSVATRIEVGRPVDVLVRESDRAQLLCLGTTGRGLVTDLVIGSTAAALVQLAHCPVLLVPWTPPWSTRSRSGVVVGLAPGELDPAVAAFAFAEAASRGCQLVAVRAWAHTVPGAAGLLEPFVDAATAQRREESALDDALTEASAQHAGVVVQQVAERGSAARLLLAAALTAELVVVGHRHHRLARLGSVASAVVHRAGCPVAVVPLLDRPAPVPAAPVTSG
ncbi:universal stress protein [Modestobacter marinus]|nr:universal stress protein [Modestobacter marinus]NIH68540.1 nucleotide-binding universal stress UspA family protein [Modestobacter marinus]